MERMTLRNDSLRMIVQCLDDSREALGTADPNEVRQQLVMNLLPLLRDLVEAVDAALAKAEEALAVDDDEEPEHKELDLELVAQTLGLLGVLNQYARPALQADPAALAAVDTLGNEIMSGWIEYLGPEAFAALGVGSGGAAAGEGASAGDEAAGG
jgi:hypothetical protein